MAGRIAVAIALVTFCGAFAAPTAVSSQHVALTSLESGVLARLNEIRVHHGLAPLRLSARLTAAATEHSDQMAEDGYFGHDSADGTAFWKRIDRWFSAGGYGFWSVGENLLWSSPRIDPAHALTLWMNSAEHRANILDARWREIGISAVHVRRAPGVYHRLGVTIITTDFGVRY